VGSITIFDLSFIADRRISGVERFSIEIYEAAAGLAPDAVIALVPRGGAALVSIGRVHALPFRSKVLNQLFGVPFAIWKLRATKIVFPSFPPSPLCLLIRNLSVFRVIHDTVYWDKSSTLSRKARLYLKPLERAWLMRYRRIATVSSFSKSRLTKLFPGLLGKIEVVPNAVSGRLADPGPAPSIDKYVLSVGTIEPRKNFPFLVAVFEHLAKSDGDLNLVICGRRGWAYAGLRELCDKSQFCSRIHLITNSSDSELASYYKHCRTFVFPSIEEGFGIPLIEAMFYGRPVVAANNSAITEIVSGVGTLVDGYDINKWSAEVERSIVETPLEKQERLRERSAQYSWTASARKLIRMIENEAA
jgi:glycosyltransferase involved in cell wall biosynthesis